MPKSIDKYRRMRRAMRKAEQHANKYRMKGQVREDFIQGVKQKAGKTITEDV